MELSTEHRASRAEADKKPDFLACRMRLADHAVSRVFARETVVLNLRTGTYHGLNPTAGRMLEVLERSSTVRAAIERLAEEYEMPLEAIERDVTGLVRELVERDLVEWEDASGA